MPTEGCELGGKPGRRWGKSGKCFTYEPGSASGRVRAEAEAARQGRAIAAARVRRNDARAPRRLLTQDYPQPIENAYTKQLLRRTVQANELLNERLAPLLKKFADDIDEAAKTAKRGDQLVIVRHDQDTLEAITKRLLSVVRTTKTAFTNTAASGAEFVRQQAAAMDRGASAALKRAIRRVHGITVAQEGGATSKLITGWVRENVKQIKKMDTRFFADVERVISEGLATGRNTRQLTKDVNERFEVNRSRARLIVRDQLGTLNSQITQARQTELGIDKYTWRDSGDDRVRETHEGFDGQVFTWAKGSPEGHPGEPISCRCTADPVIEDVTALPSAAAA